MRHGGNSLQSVAVSVAIRCTAVQKSINSLKTSAIYGFLHFCCLRHLEKRPSVPCFPCDFPCFSRVFPFCWKIFSSVTQWQSVVWQKRFKKTEKIFWQFVKRLYLCSRFRLKETKVVWNGWEDRDSVCQTSYIRYMVGTRRRVNKVTESRVGLGISIFNFQLSISKAILTMKSLILAQDER